MRVNEFVTRLKKLATSTKTIYMMGCFGQPVTYAVINSKRKQYPNYYTSAKVPAMEAVVDTGTFGFDCICMVKGVLWGFTGDKNATYGGAKYASNGVPDINADQMITRCKEVSTDFSNIEVGEYLYLPGHCGIYIGDGLAVECTPKWENKVQITAVANMGEKSGYNSRRWTSHGKLPYVTYDSGEGTMVNTSHHLSSKPTESNSASKGVVVGGKVKIKPTATKYATGQEIPKWVKEREYTVQQKRTRNNRNEVLLKEIISWVYMDDVEVK